MKMALCKFQHILPFFLQNRQMEKADANSGCVYVFENKTNGKFYVGQTWNIKRRIKEHFNGHGYAKLLSAAIKKYGTSNFTTRVLKSGIGTQSRLDEEEIQAITNFNSLAPNGYNIKKGGVGGQHSESTKRLIGSYHKGKIVSEETKNKLRLANINKPPITENVKQRIIEGLRNHHEQKEKPVYIFDALTHEKIHMYKNMTQVQKHAVVACHSVMNSLSHEWAFVYSGTRCYARYIDQPLNKDFRGNRRMISVNILGRSRTLSFSSITEAEEKMNVGRGVVSSLVRGKTVKTKGVYNNQIVYFTAKYSQ